MAPLLRWPEATLGHFKRVCPHENVALAHSRWSVEPEGGTIPVRRTPGAQTITILVVALEPSGSLTG